MSNSEMQKGGKEKGLHFFMYVIKKLKRVRFSDNNHCYNRGKNDGQSFAC